MEISFRWAAGLILSFAGFMPALASAQSPGSDLVGPWVITSGVNQLGTLMVRGASAKPGGFELDALFGGKPGVKAEIVQGDTERRLLAVLPNGSNISAKAVSPTVFEGTGTDGAGAPRDVRLVYIAARPAESTPPQCAACHGGWAGTWGQGVGATRLWVLGIDASCNVSYQYNSTSSDEMPALYSGGAIKDGTLAIRCGGGGTCLFTVKGDEVSASFSGGGGTNNAVFRRVASK